MLVWEVADYSKKLEPTLTAGKKGKGVKDLDAAGLSIDETNKLIYLADCGNSRIQVCNKLRKRNILGTMWQKTY